MTTGCAPVRAVDVGVGYDVWRRARSPRNPMPPTTVPNTKETTASVRCTQKYAVGWPLVEREPAAVLDQVLDESDPDDPAPHPEGEQEPGDGAAELHVSSIAAARPVPWPGWGGRRDFSAAAACTFSSVPAPRRPPGDPCWSPPPPCRPLALTAPVALAAPADSPSVRATSPSATPPANMSTVGGTRLGQAGTQVNLGERRPGAAQGHHRALLDRRGRRVRRGARRAQRALAAAPGEHPEDAVRGHRAAEVPEDAEAQGRRPPTWRAWAPAPAWSG